MYQISAKSIITAQNGINIYRGATDGCIVSKVRAKGARIENPDEMGIKMDAPALISQELRKKRNRGVIYTGLSDPYNALEEEYQIMRECLKAIARFDFGIDITTRESLILRDKDILIDIASHTKCVIRVILPTLDEKKYSIIEGEEKDIQDVLKILEGFKDTGVDVILDIFPMLPHINADVSSLEKILELGKEYRVKAIDTHDFKTVLQSGMKEYFYQELKKRDKDTYFLYEEEGLKDSFLVDKSGEMGRFYVDFCRENGILFGSKDIQDYARKYENRTEGVQLTLFDLT